MTHTLRDSLEGYSLQLPDEQVALLERYCHLLWDWNQKLNLTRHTNYDVFVARDVIDSLAFADRLQADEEVLDLGTGGGVPGVLIAILRPDLQISLCESVGKKASAIDAIVNDLQLQVPVYHARGEDLLEDFRYSSIVARAVGPMSRVLKWLEPHWISIGRLLLTKGPRWVDERGEARHRGLLHSLELRCIHRYLMPGTESESVILQIEPKRS